MDAWLQILRERIWPSRPGTRRGTVLGNGLATPIVLLLVALVAGPDLFVYVELSTLLDLLGAALFLFVFAMGFRLLLTDVAAQLRSAFVPENLVLMATSPAPNSWRIFWAGVITFRALRICMIIAVILAELGLLLVWVLSRFGG